jgi:hypothetical protein
MWQWAGERHKYCQALCKQLQHYCSPFEECSPHVVLTEFILHHISGVQYRRSLCDMTRCLGHGM